MRPAIQLQLGREIELQWNTFSTSIYELTGHSDEGWWRNQLAQVLVPVSRIKWCSWFQIPEGERTFVIVKKQVIIDGFEKNHWFWYKEAKYEETVFARSPLYHRDMLEDDGKIIYPLLCPIKVSLGLVCIYQYNYMEIPQP